MRLMMAIACLGAFAASASAQPDGPAADLDPAHTELRALREDLVDAIIKGDIERQLRYAHEDIVVTWQDGRVVRGTDGLLAFLEEIDPDEQNKVFQGYKQPPTPTELSILHGGDTAVSYGTSVASYKLVGQEIDLTNHWTATLARQEDRWVLTSYHVSGNLLDNPLLNAAKKGLYLAAGIGVAAGLILGVLVGRLIRRKTPATG